MKKDCDTCRFEDYCLAFEPCKSCVLAEEPDSFWQPKEGSNENVETND